MKNFWGFIRNFLRRKAEKSADGVYWFFKKTIRWCLFACVVMFTAMILSGCQAQAFRSVWDRIASDWTVKNQQKITDKSFTYQEGISPVIMLALAVLIVGQNWISNRKNRNRTQAQIDTMKSLLEAYLEDNKHSNVLLVKLVDGLLKQKK